MGIRKGARIAAAVVLLAATIPAVTLAWGDSNGGRPTYRLVDENGNETTSDGARIVDKDGNPAFENGEIVFNSIENGSFGDERNFVGARENTGDNDGAVWKANEIQVEDGKTYLIRLYVHNNNPNGTEAIARDVTTHIAIPDTTAQTVNVEGFINSSNADPENYWDYVRFTSDKDFCLEYVPGTAQFENNHIGGGGSKGLSDNIVKGYVPIGYDQLDGNIPGCYQYSGYVGITVRPQFVDDSFPSDPLRPIEVWATVLSAIAVTVGTIVTVLSLRRRKKRQSEEGNNRNAP